MQKIPNSIIRQSFHLFLILLLGGLIFWQLHLFVPAFLGSYTLYILLRRPYVFLISKWNFPKSLAAMALMILSLLIIVLPLNTLIRMLSSRILPQVKDANAIWTSVEKFIHEIELKYNVAILTKEYVGNLSDFVLRESSALLSATFNSLGLIAIMYFVLFFLLTGGAKMEHVFTSWLPLKVKNLNYFREHLNSLVFSNAIGIPLVSLCQSIVAFIGYWIAGVEEPFLWFVVTFFASFIPFLGAMIVYVPLSIMLMYNGQNNYGIFLLLYGFAIVGSVDNLFRLAIQKSIGDTHPLITIFGVIAGLKLFGFIGLIFGPIIISLFILLVDVYLKEYGEFSQDA
jgi:predicted PurR-regulated permease PerM